MKPFRNCISPARSCAPQILLGIFFCAAVLGGLWTSLEASHEPCYRDYDEGLDLEKAALYGAGYPLYQGVWSDQPPLFTALLAAWIKLGARSLNTFRLLNAGLSIMAGLALFVLIWRSRGRVAAWGSLILLFTARRFAFFAPAIMFDIPAIAFALWAVVCMSLHRSGFKSRIWLLGVSSFMAAALNTKFLSVLIMPVLFVQLAIATKDTKSRFTCYISDSLYFVFYTAILTVLLLTLLSPAWIGPGISQLILPHYLAVSSNISSNLELMRQWATEVDWPVFALAGAGLLCGLLNRRWGFLIPFSWFLSALTFAVWHQPLWNHHFIFLEVPLVWMAAQGVSESCLGQSWCCALNGLSHRFLQGMVSVVIVLLAIVELAVLPQKLASLYGDAKHSCAAIDREVIAELQHCASKTHWLVTDVPLYAFMAGLKVPPQLAVISWKRLYSGQLSTTLLQDVMKDSQPELVLLGRFPEFAEMILPLLEKNYRKLSAHKQFQLYLRKTVFELD